MTRTWVDSILQARRTLWVVMTIAFGLLALTNLPWQLDDYDQAKQAFTSFEMVKQGHWWYQHTPHDHIATKPPLVAWVSAVIFEATRSWAVGWRLPSLAAAIGLSIVLWRAAEVAYGAIAGLIGFGAFTLNLLTPRLATLVRTDMPLALVISLIGIFIWHKLQSNQPWVRRDRIWMFALLTAGMLIKGPIIYAFLLPGIVFFQWWRRKTNATSAWCGWWPWLASLGIFLVWALAGIRFVPGFYDQVVVREFLGRFDDKVHRPQPIYFYLPHLLHKFAPWTILLLIFGWCGWRGRGERTPGVFRRVAPDTMWLLCWSLGGLILMSCIPSKRVDRIFPVIPPLCLLLAAQVGKRRAENESSYAATPWLAATLGAAVLFAAGYGIFKIGTGLSGHRSALVEFGGAIRRLAAENNWRYEAVPASDEGLLLYLDRPRFTKPEEAVQNWKAGQLDALIVPSDETANYLRDLSGNAQPLLQSAERAELKGTYSLLVRGKQY